MKHVFAVSAFNKSPYLEECLISLKNQLEKDEVIICTSTPNEFISGLAKKYDFKLFSRDGESSLKDDWNFCIECAVNYLKANLVTVAHQDDIYLKNYGTILKRAIKLYPDMSLFCARYETIDKNGHKKGGRAEKVKRILRLGLRLRKIADLRLIKRSALIFGNAICCPSCTYNIQLTGLPLFKDNDRFVIDWKTLLRLSEMPGRFVCSESILLKYRIHEDTQTKKTIIDHTRENEEIEVFQDIWPKPIARFFSFVMRLSYDSYK